MEIFGMASVASYLRGLTSSLETSRIQGMVDGITVGFGMPSTDGDTLFFYYQSSPDLPSTAGFDNVSWFALYQQDVENIINKFLPNEAEINRLTLSIAVYSIIWAYALNTAIQPGDLVPIIGSTLVSVAQLANNNAPFKTVKNGNTTTIIQPFSAEIIASLTNKDYAASLAQVAASAKTSQTQLANYNWFDVSSFFAKPDLQVMKDIESQYYYISGVLNYMAPQEIPPDCIGDQIILQTYTGETNTTFIRNTPCKQVSSYVGPLEQLTFNRTFSDGPCSSGDFTLAVKSGYFDFDQSILPPKDYLSNAINLYSFYQDTNGNYIPLCTSPTFIDANGRYDILSELSASPGTLSCVDVPQRMHVGDELPRRQGKYNSHGKCIGWTLVNVTGFKYVSFEIPSTGFNQNLSYYKLNPVPAISGVLQRALNLNPNPYVATQMGDFYFPFTLDIYENQHWYVGPPQLNGTNTLPSFAFYQHFDSTNFNDNMKIVMFPCLSSSDGTTAGDTSRTFSISTMMAASGSNDAHFPYKNPYGTATFYTGISSNLAGADTIAKQCFGMGDAFEGQYTITSYPAWNSNFSYTGYAATSSNGQVVDLLDVAQEYNGFILGSPVQYMQYINGYSGAEGVSSISQLVALDGSGNFVNYYYLDERLYSNVILDAGIWNYFAPVPSHMDGNSTRLFYTQQVENYLPRYSSGPFASYMESFLYPNANQTARKYGIKSNGFPVSITFDVEIREEAIKEIYGTFTILPNGNISTYPTFVTPIRSVSTNGKNINPVTNQGTGIPLMYTIFQSSDIYQVSNYDFTTWAIGSDFEYTAKLPVVDINWSPNTYNYDNVLNPPLGYNNNTYTSDMNGNLVGNLFKNGVLQTGNGGQAHTIITGPGQMVKTVYDENPTAVALYHGFHSWEQAGTITYVPPIYNLASGDLFVSPQLLNAFPEMQTFLGYIAVDFNNHLYNLTTGTDPIFNQYVGGRVGGPNQEAEGGCHSEGVIGDKWNGMVYQNYGAVQYECMENGGVFKYNYREPDKDSELILFDVTQTGSTLWLKNMAFYPFYQERLGSEFTSNIQIPYSRGNTSGFLSTVYQNNLLNFDLSSFFPMIPGIGWYDENPLVIGPFDRDVSLCVEYPNSVVASSELFINGWQLTNMQYGLDECASRDWLRQPIFVDTGIILNENGRGQYFSIMSKVLSGNSFNINVFAEKLGSPNDPTGIGMMSGAIVSLKYLPSRYGSLYDGNLFSGEEGWTDPYRYVSGMMPIPLKINNQTLEGLAGSYSTPIFSRSGLYYPLPDDSDNFADFTGNGSADKYGNITYPRGFNIQTYWQNKVRESQQPMTLSGWREGSRLSIIIKNVNLNFDVVPYQQRQVVIPSGTCIVSGQMGYLAQAESSVFSEGIIVQNITAPDPLTGLYNPMFVSDVLQRLSGIISGITGSSLVISAPSIVEQRAFISGISDDETYVGEMTQPPQNYNKLLWPALSDLEYLNAGETIEQLPTDDGNTYLNSNLIFSASQGQLLPNGTNNPNVNKTYAVINEFQMYDSLSTDALLNSGVCLTTRTGPKNIISQKTMSGALAPASSSLNLINQGLF